MGLSDSAWGIFCEGCYKQMGFQAALGEFLCGGCYKVYDVGCLPVVASWADAWEAILKALFLAKDSDRRSRCSFNLDTISLWYSCASACFCST